MPAEHSAGGRALPPSPSPGGEIPRGARISDALTGAAVYDRVAERRVLRGLGPAPSLIRPLWDQRLAGTGQPAQFRHGLRLHQVLVALALGGVKCDPGDLGEQVGAAACDLP